MNHNGTTLAIIFIYLILMTTPSLFNRNGRSCQFLVYATSGPDRRKAKDINLYSRFKERLNVTSNLAEIEYQTRTSDALNSIYNLAGDVLSQQLKHHHQAERTPESESQNGNYAERLVLGENDDEADVPSPAVASSNTNYYSASNDGTAATRRNTRAGSTAAIAAANNDNGNAILAELNLQLINSPAIVSNANQSNHRQARKIQKASRMLQHHISPLLPSRRLRYRRRHRLKKFHPQTNTGKRQSSRPSEMALAPGAGRRKLSTSQYLKRGAYAVLEEQKQQAAKNMDDFWSTSLSLNSSNRSNLVLDAGSGHKMNDLAMKRIAPENGCGNGNGDGGDDGGGKIGDDDSTKPFGRSSVKWRKKLQIDGNKNNFRKTRSWPIFPFAKDQSNGLIQSSDGDGDDDGDGDENEDEDDYEDEDGDDNGNVDEEEKENEDEIRQQQISLGNTYSLRGNAKVDNGRHIHIRNTDSFPEVFARPLAESNSAPIILTGTGAGNELNEAIKNANSLLASSSAASAAASAAASSSVQDVERYSNTPFVKLDDSKQQRFQKQIQALDGASLNPPNTGMQNYSNRSDTSATNLTNVMEKVLDELETLKECKETDGTQPDGSPCDVAGSWNSETIGLQFNIAMGDPSSRTFEEGKTLEIEVTERVPPRQHQDLIQCDWVITGNTVKQVGGPFYMTAQKADRFIVATFAGLCKTCGGIPTIFGSWTFVYPAKDCQDISIAVENKRDILRRDSLEAKRKHRRDRLKSKDKGKCRHG
ncbi:uncharacterized protein LOC129943024 [Eupeodes corollae]|uniref:uncharacterized protein LOC129943024 n=1 Tax=Eupeodes corollae TaxID=290404 RepID=UPI002493B365|nr:uncharacterized protein LOC129943024 [Eupeodes corollae]